MKEPLKVALLVTTLSDYREYTAVFKPLKTLASSQNYL